VALEYPNNTIWYVQSWTGVKADLSEGSAVAVRLQRQGEPKAAKTYLLTCAHVVRGKLGGERVIRAWPPGKGHNDKEAKAVEVDPVFMELPVTTPSAANDWVVLRIEDDDAAVAAPSIKAWSGAVGSGDFCIYGYPAGDEAFPGSIVTPTRMPGNFPSRSNGDGVVCLNGVATRPGVSGGGVFREDGMRFAGLHRARIDDALQLHAVSASHILNILIELGYEFVPRPPYLPPPDDDIKPIDLEPFLAEIARQLSSEPAVLVRLEAQFGKRALDIEKSQLGAGAREEQVRADALARTLVERDFPDVLSVMKDAIAQCTTRSEEHERQVLFEILCWFLPAYDPKKAEKLRDAYGKGDVHLIEVDVASTLAAELLVSAVQKRPASIARDDTGKGRWTGVSALSAQKLHLGLGAKEEEEVITTVERWLIHLLDFDSDYDRPPEVYRSSLQKILESERRSGGNLPYVVFTIASMKGGLKREDLERISSAIRTVYPPLATLLLSNDDKVHADEPARLYSLRQILERFHK
jgi:hypothetical protein